MFHRREQFDDFYSKLIKKVSGANTKILLPESHDERILKCAIMATKLNLCQIVLLGKASDFEGVLPRQIIKKIIFIDPSDEKLKVKYISKLIELRAHKGLTIEDAKELVNIPMYFSVLALKCNDVDGVVSGCITHTADVLRPAFQIIKTCDGASIASSVMIMIGLDEKFGENGVLLFSDCGVVEYPTSEQICEIALQTVKTAKTLLEINDPRVALLSYSTKSDALNVSESIRKVKDAFLLIRRAAPRLTCDGELQVDSALDANVAKLKCPYSSLKGNANILIMPNIDAGNIGYKLAAYIAGVKSIGPIIQGLSQPVNDVSRGATAEEILGTVAITVLQANSNK